MRRVTNTFGLLLCLTGCIGKGEVTPISDEAMAAVIAEIKYEVGDYQATAAWLRSHPSEDEAVNSLPKDQYGNPKPTCGNATLSFDIVSVKMELTTTADLATNADISVKLPLGGPVPVGTLTPKYTTSHENNTTQKISTTVYTVPVPAGQGLQYETKPTSHGPIAGTLLRLRDALVRASAVGPCFDFNKPGTKDAGRSTEFAGRVDIRGIDKVLGVGKGNAPPADAQPSPAQPAATPQDASKNDASSGNTFSIGLTVTENNGGSLNLSLAIVTADLGGQAKSVSGNTITVTFKPAGNSTIFLR